MFKLFRFASQDMAIDLGTANTVVYVRDVLGRPDTDLALALACFGIGSMLVAVFAPRVLERFGDRAVMLTGAVVIPVALGGATAAMRTRRSGDSTETRHRGRRRWP